MFCPYCKSSDITCLESRPKKNGFEHYRRRVCNQCSERWSTKETYERETLAKLTNKNKILQLLEEGMSFQEIKHQLGISSVKLELAIRQILKL